MWERRERRGFGGTLGDVCVYGETRLYMLVERWEMCGGRDTCLCMYGR